MYHRCDLRRHLLQEGELVQGGLRTVAKIGNSHVSQEMWTCDGANQLDWFAGLGKASC